MGKRRGRGEGWGGRGLGVVVTKSQRQEEVGDTHAVGTRTGGQKQPARPGKMEGNAGPGSAVTR